MNPIVLLAAAYGSGNTIPIQQETYRIQYNEFQSNTGTASSIVVGGHGSVTSPTTVIINSTSEPSGNSPYAQLELIATGLLNYSFTMTSGLSNSYGEIYDEILGGPGENSGITSYSGVATTGSFNSSGVSVAHFLIMKFNDIDGISPYNILIGSFYIS